MKLNTLIRVARALRDPEPDPARRAAPLPDAVRGAADALTSPLRRDPLLQEGLGTLRDRARDWRSGAAERADTHLERLIQDAHARRGSQAPPQVTALLDARRQDRHARRDASEARRALLARASTPEQRRVLTLVARHTSWAGGQTPGELRYTALLDQLAPSGHPAEEMAVHRALWTLAEARVLAVSSHGEVVACPPGPVLALPAPR